MIYSYKAFFVAFFISYLTFGFANFVLADNPLIESMKEQQKKSAPITNSAPTHQNAK